MDPLTLLVIDPKRHHSDDILAAVRGGAIIIKSSRADFKRPLCTPRGSLFGFKLPHKTLVFPLCPSMKNWFKLPWSKKKDLLASPECIIPTEELTSHEFAKAVGLQVISCDEDEELMRELNDLSLTATFRSTKSAGRPKLDMAIFDAASESSMDSLPRTLTNSIKSPIEPVDDMYTRKLSMSPDMKIEKRGRFIVTTQPSSFYQPRQRTNSISRFTVEQPHESFIRNRSQSEPFISSGKRTRQSSVDSGIMDIEL
ncbi:hypothetical protein EDD86DRAFT_79023 [Gorgonomyces haynaldii]|nr:hypothetical protein EDD86DRAFT_79023 [Gorgonomyces haynaldii]